MSCWEHKHLYYKLYLYLKARVSTDSELFKQREAVCKEAQDEAWKL